MCRTAAIAGLSTCPEPLSPVSWMIQQAVCSVLSPASLKHAPFRQLLDTEPSAWPADLPPTSPTADVPSPVAGGVPLLCLCCARQTSFAELRTHGAESDTVALGVHSPALQMLEVKIELLEYPSFKLAVVEALNGLLYFVCLIRII
jgi:hypothetical protein